MSEEIKTTESTETTPETPEVDKESKDPKDPVVKTVNKDLFDKQASELAALKKQLQARMTDDELKEQQLADMQAQIKSFERDRNVTNYVKSLLEVGVDTKHASTMGEQLADGDFTNFFTGLKLTIDGLKKSVKAELIKDAPKPPVGDNTIGEVTKEQFNKMDYTERQEVYTKDPDLYARLMK